MGHSSNALIQSVDFKREADSFQSISSRNVGHSLPENADEVFHSSELCCDYLPLLSLCGKHYGGFEVRPTEKNIAIADADGHYLLDGDLASLGQLLQQSAKQLHFWRTHFLAARGMRLWVSVAQSQWLSTAFIDLCQQIAHQPNGQQHGLVLEVNYAALLADIHRSTEQVTRLKDMGFRVQVCNFMPSHSALTRLESCGITMAKLEQSVFRKLADSSETQSFFSQVRECKEFCVSGLKG